MATIIQARVEQKIDTAANWAVNPLILLAGEQAFVASPDGITPINFRIGDGTKTFAQLPDWINYASNMVVQPPAPGGTLPSPSTPGKIMVVAPGIYTQPTGGGTITAATSTFTVLFWNGTAWSIIVAIAVTVASKIATWTANAYSLNDQVNYLGRIWYANSAVISTDVPGTSSKWSSLLTVYDAKLDQSQVVTQTQFTTNLFDKTNFLDASTIQGNDGSLVTGTTGFRTTFFLLDPAQTQLTISGMPTINSKAWRFENSDGTLRTGTGTNFQAFGSQPQTIAIPSGAARFRFVWKNSGDATTVGDAVMVNYGATVKPYQPFSYTFVKTILGSTINPGPQVITADSDQTTDLPFAVLGADGFFRFLPTRFIYNPANGFKFGHIVNMGQFQLTGLTTATLDGDALSLGQLNTALAPINQAVGNQAIIPIPGTMTDPDVPSIDAVTTTTGISSGTTTSWTSPILSIIGGSLVVAGAGFPDNGYGKPVYVTGSNENPPVTIEFTTNGSTFEFTTKGVGQRYRILVDGYFVSTAFTSLGVTGTQYFQKITFATAKTRRITIEGANGFFFGGIRIPTGFTLTPSIRTATQQILTVGSVTSYFSRMSNYPLAIVLGDSFSEPTGTTGQQGYAAIMGKSLGWNIWQSGSGGTGYVVTGPAGRVAFGSRFQTDVAQWNPDIIVLSGGINDSAQTVATFSTAARAVMVQAKAVTSAKEVIVMSSWHNKGQPYTPGNQFLIDGVLKALALEFGFTYVDTSSLITGNGNTGAPTGNGNSDIYIGTDGTHPNDAGHTFLGLNSASIYLNAKNKFISSGIPARRMVGGTDAATTGLLNSDGTYLPTITANRIYTPPVGQTMDGKAHQVQNFNTATGFAWTFATGTVQDLTGAAVTAIPNGTVANLSWNVSKSLWIKI